MQIRQARVEDAAPLWAMIVAEAEHHGQRALLRATVETLRRDPLPSTPGRVAAPQGIFSRDT